MLFHRKELTEYCINLDRKIIEMPINWLSVTKKCYIFYNFIKWN